MFQTHEEKTLIEYSFTEITCHLENNFAIKKRGIGKIASPPNSLLT
jgi:hypothetical protein